MFSEDTAIVGCTRAGNEREYRSLVEDFTTWSNLNHLQLNSSKTKEMVLDLRRCRPFPLPAKISRKKIEVVSSYKLQMDDKLDWSVNTDYVSKKAGCIS